MTRLRTSELGAHVGERVRVAGWLHALRRLGGVSFLIAARRLGHRPGGGRTRPTGATRRGGAGVESVIAVEGAW